MQSYQWYSLAALQGYPKAVESREEIEAQLTLTQIEDAQRLAGKWRDEHPRAMREATTNTQPNPEAARTLDTLLLQSISEGENSRWREKPEAIQILEVDARITETNDSWSRFAWRLTVANRGERDARFDARIKFEDEDGFIVDDATEPGLTLVAGSSREFTGYDLIDASVAHRVSGVSAEIKQHGSR